MSPATASGPKTGPTCRSARSPRRRCAGRDRAIFARRAPHAAGEDREKMENSTRAQGTATESDENGNQIHHTRKMSAQLEEIRAHLRDDIRRVDEPQFKAMFETARWTRHRVPPLRGQER